MALTKVTGGLISTTSNYEVGVITATKFVGPIEGGVTGVTTGSDKIKVIDESSDTTCFPLFATHSDGYLAAKSGSNLLFNSNTGALTATSFSGALTGNVNGNATGLSGTPSIVVKDITAEMVSVAGTMQYEDVVNVDATGIVTAGGGLVVPANKMVTISGDLNVDGKTDIDDLSVAGVSTFTGLTTFSDNIRIADSKKILLGNLAAGDCQFIHDGNDTFIQNKTGDLKIANNVAGDVGGNIIIQAMNGENSINCVHDAQVEISFNGSQKLATTATGIAVTGEVAATQDYPTIRPTLDLNFAAVKKLDPRITYRRTGPASYVDEFGIVKLVGDNVPRFDHDGATRESKGLLIEESRTNYMEDSDLINNWTLSSNDTFTESSGAQLSTNPDGSSPAYKYTPATGAYHHRYYKTFTVPTYDTSYVASVFVKRVTAGSASNLNRYFEIELSGNLANNPAPTGHSGSHGMSSVTFDLQDLTSQYAGNSAVKANGVVGDPKIEDYGNGWYRCSYVFNPGQSDGNSSLTAVMWLGHPATMASEAGNEQGNGNPSFYIWGAMVEKGSFLTSYIPNHSALQNTRGYEATTVEGTEFSDIFDTDFKQFSMVADYDNDFGVGASGQNYALIDMWGEATGYDDRIEIFRNDASPYHLETRAYGQGNSTFANGLPSASSVAKSQRFAASWYVPDYSNTTSRRFVVSMGGEGVDVISDGSGTTVPLVTRLGLGCNPTRLDFTPGRLYFKRFMLYNRTLSDGQLQNLSAQ